MISEIVDEFEFQWKGKKRPSFIEGIPHLCNASNFFIETKKKKLFLIYFLSLFSLHSGTFSFLILILVVFPFYTSFPLFFWCFLMNQITFFYLVFIIASLSLTSGNIKYKEKKRFINSLFTGYNTENQPSLANSLGKTTSKEGVVLFIFFLLTKKEY